MKLLILTIFFIGTWYYKYTRKRDDVNKDILNVKPKYYTKFTSYPNVSTSIYNFTEPESKIFEILNKINDQNYNIRVTGGWVADKVK